MKFPFLLSLLFLLLTLTGLSQPYGVWEDPNLNQYFLVQVDPVTGTKTNIGPGIPGMTGLIIPGTSTIQIDSNWYVVRGNFSGSFQMVVVDLTTGNIVHNNVQPDNIIGLEYNYNNDSIYGLRISAGDYYLGTVDPATGVFTDIALLPGVSGHSGGTFTLDTQDGAYNFQGFVGPTSTYLNIDIQSGTILNSNAWMGNVQGQEYNCNNDTIYGIWEDQAISTYFLVAVDPAAGTFATIDSLPPVDGIVTETATFGSQTSYYEFVGFEGPATKLFRVDVTSASVVNNSAFAFNPAGLENPNSCMASVTPVADFQANAVSIVVGDVIAFTDLSTNFPTQWSWTFAGGTPASSTAQHPFNIAYDSAGCYEVTLVATNLAGSDTETKTCYILVDQGLPPDSDFIADDTTIAVGGSVNFTSLDTLNSTFWEWSFPGGTPDTSNAQHPTGIVYDTSGCYDVILKTFNNYGADITLKGCYIQVGEAVGIETPGALANVQLYPNPAREQLNVSSPNGAGQLTLLNSLGAVVAIHKVSAGVNTFNISELTAGMYIFQFSDKQGNLLHDKLLVR